MLYSLAHVVDTKTSGGPGGARGRPPRGPHSTGARRTSGRTARRNRKRSRAPHGRTRSAGVQGRPGGLRAPGGGLPGPAARPEPGTLRPVPGVRLPPSATGGRRGRQARHEHRGPARPVRGGALAARTGGGVRPAEGPGLPAGLPDPVVRPAGAVPAQPEPGGDPRQEEPPDRGHRRRAHGRGDRRQVPEAQRDPRGPIRRRLLQELHRPAHHLQLPVRPGAGRLRHRRRPHPVERRVRLPDLRERPRAVQELRVVRQRRLRHLPRQRLEHQRPVSYTHL